MPCRDCAGPRFLEYAAGKLTGNAWQGVTPGAVPVSARGVRGLDTEVQVGYRTNT